MGIGTGIVCGDGDEIILGEGVGWENLRKRGRDEKNHAVGGDGDNLF